MRRVPHHHYIFCTSADFMVCFVHLIKEQNCALLKIWRRSFMLLSISFDWRIHFVHGRCVCVHFSPHVRKQDSSTSAWFFIFILCNILSFLTAGSCMYFWKFVYGCLFIVGIVVCNIKYINIHHIFTFAHPAINVFVWRDCSAAIYFMFTQFFLFAPVPPSLSSMCDVRVSNEEIELQTKPGIQKCDRMRERETDEWQPIPANLVWRCAFCSAAKQDEDEASRTQWIRWKVWSNFFYSSFTMAFNVFSQMLKVSSYFSPFDGVCAFLSSWFFGSSSFSYCYWCLR